MHASSILSWLSLFLDMPDFSLENELDGIVAGVDEVGRGALAGPVISAAVVFLNRINIATEINDSKKLTPQKREELYEKIILDTDIKYSIGAADINEINQYNILGATKLSMKRALINLNMELDYVLIDGNQPPDVPWNVKCVINGDNLSVSIAAASIIAKVTRDRFMMQLHHGAPEYNWYRNKGYGTKEHIQALNKYGVSNHHRKNFAPVSLLTVKYLF
ncbi:MAG: ribonuclease HII [Candidatus Mesenet longicola]|uniref:Ribonuclease HII n=1 Tax=Candidatus Mesenet longicola TaxID=1892558 RepID=A0A8J3HTA0_9RICK|nr:MAG: ribonuclease HII [Candidatus Mesenet longicola]GHM59858.1 MAG: ribonuclease HII [Candidatus Mesenet longicola]